jgi:antitoxin VapB
MAKKRGDYQNSDTVVPYLPPPVQMCRPAYGYVYTREVSYLSISETLKWTGWQGNWRLSTRTTKIQAVKDALRHELARAQMKQPLWEGVKPLRDEIAAYPDSCVIVDKAFFDELSGETGE